PDGLLASVYHLTRIEYKVDQPEEVCIKEFAPRNTIVSPIPYASFLLCLALLNYIVGNFAPTSRISLTLLILSSLSLLLHKHGQLSLRRALEVHHKMIALD
ncbi:hypothetical protein Ddye_004955, partial [Dipteronia dyeriana]